MGNAGGGAAEGVVLSETLRGRPTGRRGGELLPPAVSGFLNAAAAAFFVKRTAVRRLTPEGDPVSCGLTAALLGLVLTGVVGIGGGVAVSRCISCSGVEETTAAKDEEDAVAEFEVEGVGLLPNKLKKLKTNKLPIEVLRVRSPLKFFFFFVLFQLFLNTDFK